MFSPEKYDKSKNLNQITLFQKTASQQNQALHQHLVQEAELFISSHHEFHRFWQALRKLAIQTEKTINKRSFESLFSTFQPLMYQCLKVITIE